MATRSRAGVNGCAEGLQIAISEFYSDLLEFRSQAGLVTFHGQSQRVVCGGADTVLAEKKVMSKEQGESRRELQEDVQHYDVEEAFT